MAAVMAPPLFVPMIASSAPNYTWVLPGISIRPMFYLALRTYNSRGPFRLFIGDDSFRQVRLTEIDSAHIGAGEISVRQVRATQIRTRDLIHEFRALCLTAWLRRR